MTSTTGVNHDSNEEILPPTNQIFQDDDLANFLTSLQPITGGENAPITQTGLSPARQYRATHRPYVPTFKGFIHTGPSLYDLVTGTQQQTIHGQVQRHPVVRSLAAFPRSFQPFIRWQRKHGGLPDHKGPRYLPTLITVFSIFLALATGPLWSPAQAPSLNALDQPHKACKTYSDKDPRVKRTMIAKSDKPLILKLSNCRENDLHHVSCQFTDADGNDHWLYIPGLKLPASN
jgi:hypothetical protein